MTNTNALDFLDEQQVTLAKGYANALFQLAREADTLEAVAAELHALYEVFSSDQNLVKAFMHAASLSKEDTARLIAPIQEGASPLLRNTLAVMASQNHVVAIPALADSFRQVYEAAHSIGHVSVYSGRSLPEALQQQISDRLKSMFGLTKAYTHFHVDASLLGGLYVEYNGLRFDASYRSKLEKLETALAR